MIGIELDGRYRVLAKLGEGGSGEVYLVEHLLLARKEALKILRSQLADTPQLVARFRREARAINRVQHPNIVRVFDFGRLPDGRFFLAMEYADGRTISELLGELGPFAVRRALHVLAQLAEAVDYAHGLGVIHRDLKPQNLLLVEGRDPPDLLKVVDFGFAKIIAPEYVDSMIGTGQNTLFGTPAYMAPELVDGSRTDPRSDLYAIGCIAMEMLTGDPPFAGNALQMVAAHLVQLPSPPSSRRRDNLIGPELDRVVLRCLEKPPEARFASGRELAEAIRAVPGYGDGRTPQGRASAPTLITPFVPFPEDVFEGEETLEKKRVVAPDASGQLSGAHRSSLPELRLELHRAIRGFAEALVDQGIGDVQLAIGVASAAELESQLTELVRAVHGLEAQTAEVERRLEDREASLRFAIGELGFERVQGAMRGAGNVDELELQIRELEARLAAVREELGRELAAATERGITLAASIAALDERLAVHYRQLMRLVEQLDRGGHEYAPHRDRVRAAREQIERQTRLG
jgi:serine/threonine protein kinase